MVLLVRTEARLVRTSNYIVPSCIVCQCWREREGGSCIVHRSRMIAFCHLKDSNTKVGSLQLLCGGFAGSTAALCTTPFDVVKTRVQLQVM